MDPNAALNEIRALAAEILDPNRRVADRSSVDAQRLAELLQGLDRWISRGGFLPKAWEPPDTARAILGEIRQRLTSASDFQLGPGGRDHFLIARIDAALGRPPC
jgi:hypothetical protein